MLRFPFPKWDLLQSFTESTAKRAQDAYNYTYAPDEYVIIVDDITFPFPGDFCHHVTVSAKRYHFVGLRSCHNYGAGKMASVKWLGLSNLHLT
jgi:hypothetical protein